MQAAKRSTPWVGLAVAVLLSGCGGKPARPPLYPVSGRVVVDSKPAAGVLVGLHPEGNTGLTAQRSYGETKADGSFDVTTFNPGDGAPAGKYRVTLIWAPSVPGGDPQPDRLQGRYSNPERPFATIRVEPGPNRLESFQVKTR
jgi:hypothetical protein